MSYFIYIPRSSSNKLYIGQTNNLYNRGKQHLTKNWKAAKFTKDGDGFKLVYFEEYTSRLEVMTRENQLKGWSRAKKDALIVGNKELLKKLSKSISKDKVEEKITEKNKKELKKQHGLLIKEKLFRPRQD